MARYLRGRILRHGTGMSRYASTCMPLAPALFDIDSCETRPQKTARNWKPSALDHTYGGANVATVHTVQKNILITQTENFTLSFLLSVYIPSF